MAIKPPNNEECLINKRCLSGPNVGLAYRPGDECDPGGIFDPETCDCTYRRGTIFYAFEVGIVNTGRYFCADNTPIADVCSGISPYSGSINNATLISYSTYDVTQLRFGQLSPDCGCPGDDVTSEVSFSLTYIDHDDGDQVKVYEQNQSGGVYCAPTQYNETRTLKVWVKSLSLLSEGTLYELGGSGEPPASCLDW